MRRPLLLVDFDGVWTDMRSQAEAVTRAAEQELSTLAATGAADTHAALERVRQLVRATPERFGWQSGGRISAFADEDPYLLHNASMAAADELALTEDQAWKHYRDAVRAAGHASLNEFGSAVFAKASHAWLRDHGHDMLPDAVGTMRLLLERSDVLVCTNFSTDAVAQTWRRHGLEPGTERGARFRIRGEARKHELTADPPRSIELAGRRVAVDRGHYLGVLQEERPDAVVGDVLSLDLAAPIALRREDPAFRALRLWLVRTPFTARWALDVAADPSVGLGLLERVAALCDLG